MIVHAYQIEYNNNEPTIIQEAMKALCMHTSDPHSGAKVEKSRLEFVAWLLKLLPPLFLLHLFRLFKLSMRDKSGL